jgi:ABC-type sugar transport system ATPase subunit
VSTIRLEDVTKIYPKRLSLSRASRAHKGRDRAFAERVATQAERDYEQQTGQEGPVMALDQVNLTIPEGQTLAVVGPSGCGKSTLLRVIAGLEPDYRGHVFYDDQPMEDIPPRDRYIGMVFQNYALYPHFEGRGNLAFFFRLRQISDEETEERIRITSEIMGIGFHELLRRKPGTLSGGQQQRVAIGRAIVRNPRLFLFDEPLSNLDAKLRAQTRVEIKRLLRRFQITAIYVTHDQVEAMTLGDQIAVMRAGRIEQVGTYQALRQKPINMFVAGFLGSPPMNLFDGGVVGEEGLHLSEIIVPLPDTIKAQLHAGQAVTLGVRPEAALVITDERPAPEGLRLHGVVEVVQPDFARRTQLVYTRTGTLFYAATAELTRRPLLIGEEIEVVFPTDQLYFFESENETRIG